MHDEKYICFECPALLCRSVFCVWIVLTAKSPAVFVATEHALETHDALIASEEVLATKQLLSGVLLAINAKSTEVVA